MSRVAPEIRALADAAYAAINAGDREAFVALTAESVEFTSLVAESEGETFRGHDGVRAWWETSAARSRTCIGRCSTFAGLASGP